MLKKIYTIFLLIVCAGSLYGSELQDDIDRATAIIRDFKDLPEGILNDAKGLAIINVIKAGFIFSGRGGEGLVIARTSGGWSAPSAIVVGGAGFGFQIGAEVTEFVIVLNTQDAVDAFARGGNVTLGGDLSVAAGPVGRTAEAGVAPFAAVYTYSKSQGLFAGVSLEGTVLVARNRANRKFYGRDITPEMLLSGKVAPPMSAKALYQELREYQ